MGQLVAAGGVYVREPFIHPLQTALDALCHEYGFLEGAEFKWSPGRETWMHQNLTGDRRASFFSSVLEKAREHGSLVIVAIEEQGHTAATGADTAEEDVVRLLLERADNHARSLQATALVISDRPGGGRTEEDRFVEGCLAMLRTGTRFVQFRNLSSVVTTPSRLHRLVQLADLVTGATAAFVGGQRQYAEPTFERIRPMLRNDLGRIGVGIKLHPDFKFANLYHWLLGDDYIVRYPNGHPLPNPSLPYAASPDQP